MSDTSLAVYFDHFGPSGHLVAYLPFQFSGDDADSPPIAFLERALGVAIGLFQVEITMSFSSTIQILKINEVEKGVSRKTGQPWERHTAECLLLSDDGSIDCVGRLMLPEAIRTAGVTTGTFRAGFTLHVPTYGDAKGDITARLVSLSPVPTRAASAPAAVAAKAV